MFTKTEKKIFVLLALLFAVGFISKIVFKSSVVEFQKPAVKVQPDSTHRADSLEKQTPAVPIKVDKEAEIPRDNSKIDVNTAVKSELMSISGIGPVLAGAIIDYRDKNGHFKKPEELINVKGIGPKKLEKILPFVVIKDGK